MSDPITPCVKVCALDPSGRYCLGCLRTRQEIGAWSRLDDGQRLAIMAECERRRAGRAERVGFVPC
ncbi:MAG: DUF1289 domain-containing protein [Alphaproteobacteria bacterium]|nr:DUF1289 domain-containing protein [Alphaproteobacteria bacterium]